MLKYHQSPMAEHTLIRSSSSASKEERLLGDLGERIRDVRAGPDGALWLSTDSANGRILRVTPDR